MYNGYLFGHNENWSYSHSGKKRILGSTSDYGNSYTSGDTIEVHVSIAENWIEFYKNGES